MVCLVKEGFSKMDPFFYYLYIMKTMDKQKTKYGIIEIMPNGNIYGYVNVTRMTSEREVLIMTDYLNLGYSIKSNEYKVMGGNVSSIDFKYLDEDGEVVEGSAPIVNHGYLIMKTRLEKYVPTKDK